MQLWETIIFIQVCLFMLRDIVLGATDLARGKHATQSSFQSTYYSKASNVVDGKKDLVSYYDGSCSKTQSKLHQWWMVDLGKTYTIRSVAITCVQSCCYHDNRDFAIEVSTEHPSELSGYPNLTKAQVCLTRNTTLPPFRKSFAMLCDNPVTGRYVRVVKTKGKRPISLCEFEVYEEAIGVRQPQFNTTNLALRKPVEVEDYNSSEAYFKKEFATDGIREGYAGTKQCAISELSHSSWLTVDLEWSYTIDKICLTNEVTFDGKKLANFTVEISAENPKYLPGFPNRTNAHVCLTQTERVPVGYGVVYQCTKPVTGRYVRLVKVSEPNTTSEFYVCELEVYGRKAKPKELTRTKMPMLWFSLVAQEQSGKSLSSEESVLRTKNCTRQAQAHNDLAKDVKPYLLVDLNDGRCHFLHDQGQVKDIDKSSDWLLYQMYP